MTATSLLKKGIEGSIGICLLVLLASCSHPKQMTWNDLLQHPAIHNMNLKTLDCPPFQLAVVIPQQSEKKTLRIYIEGDGLAWRTRRCLSSNPTPVVPTALLLMQEDPDRDKAYLARPCQYLQNNNCDNRYWSTDRFSGTVVNSMNEAVTQLKTSGGYQRIELVGFSGGGAIAALIAAQRDDVDILITVAGNLDHQAFTELHHVTPLTGSLNPPDFATQLEEIKQIHFVGGDDKIIPVDIFNSYAQRFSTRRNLTKRIVAGVSHRNGWTKEWKTLLMESR